MKFKDLQIKENIKSALLKMHFKEASPIQAKVIPYALDGFDIIGQAQTGTGKTAAFAIPLIQYTNASSKSVQHLIICPTRELATQIYDQINLICQDSKIKTILILGGMNYSKQFEQLRKNPQILIATPGRLEDLLERKKVKLDNLKSFTLDEADELLKIGFYKNILNILNFIPKERQNYFFTATFDKKTKELANIMTSKNVKIINVSSGLQTVKTIEQNYVVLKEKSKFLTLIKFLDLHHPNSVVIFGRTKRRAAELADALNQLNFNSAAIQGDMSQPDRNRVLEKFRKCETNILVATDVMARGIDVNHIKWVINFDLPQEIEYYTHRIGRTGRNNQKGYSLSFVKSDELDHMKIIAKKTRSDIFEISIPADGELNDARAEHLLNYFNHVLDKQRNDEKRSIRQHLLDNYSQKELAIILAHYVAKEKGDKNKIKLSPEPSVSRRKSQSFKNWKGHSKSSRGRSDNRGRKFWDSKSRNKNNIKNRRDSRGYNSNSKNSRNDLHSNRNSNKRHSSNLNFKKS